MKLFIAGGNDTVSENALRLVLDTVKSKHKLTYVAYSRAFPLTQVVERWASGTKLMYGIVQAQSQEVFWDMVDSVIALPGAPESLLESAKQYSKPVWEPFKPKVLTK